MAQKEVMIVSKKALEDVADTIRALLDTEAGIAVEDLDNEVAKLYKEPTGNKEITANGTEIDVKDYATVTVAVANTYTAEDEGKVVDNGALVAQTEKYVTEEGDYDTTKNNVVHVTIMNMEEEPI